MTNIAQSSDVKSLTFKMKRNKRGMANGNSLCRHNPANWYKSHDNEQQNLSSRAVGHFAKEVPVSELTGRSRCLRRSDLFSTELTPI